MFSSRVRLFRLFGIPISLDLSWLIILALLTWMLATGLYAQAPATSHLSEAERWLLSLGTALAFFLCVVLHELGHALVARRMGMEINGITLFLFGGVAELRGEPPSARAEFWMAVAGPIVSAVLGVGLWFLAESGAEAGWPGPAVLFLVYLAIINLMVLVFNLIPAFPLDGGRILRSALWAAMGNLRRATRIAAMLGQGFAWFLIIYGILAIIYGPDLPLGGVWNGIWLILIGMFLNRAAQASYQQVIIKEVLRGEPVRRFMNPEPIVVPPSLDLHHWVDDYVYRYHRKTFPVASNGHLEGWISTGALSRIPRNEWDLHTVGEVMRHDVQEISIPPDVDALDALSKMQRTGASRLLVTEGDRLVGIVSLKDLLRFLHLKIELEGDNQDRPAPPATWPRGERRETPAAS
jgi:Zn-dependent protease/CBS domain-containing protein